VLACTGHISGHRASSPMPIEALQEQEVRARVSAAFRKRSVAEFCLNPNSEWVIGSSMKFRVILLTARMSRASTTLTQSLSTNLKADHLMCLTRHLSRRIVVMGPYISSAEVKNNPMGYRNISQLKQEK